MSPTTPRNGRQFCGLLVGGSSVPVELGPSLLSEYGVKVDNFWTSFRQIQSASNQLPRGTDAVLIMTDISGSDMIRAAVQIAKACRVPYALIGRKKSAWINGMRISGFVQRPSWWTPQGPKEERVMSEPKPNGVSSKQPSDMQFTAAPPVQEPHSVDTSQRYVNSGRPWVKEEMQALLTAVEAWKVGDDAGQFVDRLWQASGTYRTPHTLSIHVRGLRVLLGEKIVALVTALEKVVRTLRKARHQTIQMERELWDKHHKIGDWTSYRFACEIAPGARNRISGKTMYDRHSGVLVVPRALLQEVIDLRERRGFRDGEPLSAMLTVKECTTEILSQVQTTGPFGRAYYWRHKNGRAAILGLIAQGQIEEINAGGGVMLRLPGQELPKRKTKPRAPKEAPKETAAPVPQHPARPPAAAADSDAALRQQIFTALRAGEITAKDAAEMLRGLVR